MIDMFIHEWLWMLFWKKHGMYLWLIIRNNNHEERRHGYRCAKWSGVKKNVWFDSVMHIETSKYTCVYLFVCIHQQLGVSCTLYLFCGCYRGCIPHCWSMHIIEYTLHWWNKSVLVTSTSKQQKPSRYNAPVVHCMIGGCFIFEFPCWMVPFWNENAGCLQKPSNWMLHQPRLVLGRSTTFGQPNCASLILWLQMPSSVIMRHDPLFLGSISCQTSLLSATNHKNHQPSLVITNNYLPVSLVVRSLRNTRNLS